MASRMVIALPGRAAMGAAGVAYAVALQVSAPSSAKKPTPAPIPTVAGALRKAVMASPTAAHLVGGTITSYFLGSSHPVSAAEQPMDTDRSTMRNRSTAMSWLSLDSSAQAASGSSATL